MAFALVGSLRVDAFAIDTRRCLAFVDIYPKEKMESISENQRRKLKQFRR
jgi:hypothetical protein